MIYRFDPAADLPNEIETPDERVMFIRSVVQFMATKSHVKVSISIQFKYTSTKRPLHMHS